MNHSSPSDRYNTNMMRTQRYKYGKNKQKTTNLWHKFCISGIALSFLYNASWTAEIYICAPSISNFGLFYILKLFICVIKYWKRVFLVAKQM